MSETTTTQSTPEELSAQHAEEAAILAEWAEEARTDPDAVDSATLSDLAKQREEDRQLDGSAAFEAQRAAENAQAALDAQQEAQQGNDWRQTPDAH